MLNLGVEGHNKYIIIHVNVNVFSGKIHSNIEKARIIVLKSAKKGYLYYGLQMSLIWKKMSIFSTNISELEKKGIFSLPVVKKEQ